MEKYPLILSFSFMVISWILGIYFITEIYTPTIIIPLFNEFLWMREYKGLLGLTTLFTIITLPLIIYMLRKRASFVKIKSWYFIAGASNAIWLFTIAAQCKIVAYNLGICH